MDAQEAERDAQAQDDKELRVRVASKSPASMAHIFAKMELERRERRKSFWRKDIVPWIAIFISLVSLSLTIHWRR